MSIFGKNSTTEAVTKPKASDKATEHADMRARSREVIRVDEWPNDRPIPSNYSDWLAFCLYDHIFPAAHGMNIDDVLMVRYDLASFRRKRIGNAFMIPICPDVFFLEKFGKGHSYIVRDRKGKAIGLVHKGLAIGKGCQMKISEYNLFPTGGLAKSMKDELNEAAELFGGQTDKINVWKSENTCFQSIGDMK